MNGRPHALVIGGTRGIGRAVVRVLEADGYDVSVIGRRAPSAGDGAGPTIRYWAADLVEHDQLTSVLDEIVSERGTLNSLVFLQRYRGQGDSWAGEIDTSLTATKTVIEHLSEQFADLASPGANGIVLVSSVFGRFVVEQQPVSYHVAKAALEQMVRYYAVVLGSMGIRVNGVSPSTVLKDESKDYYLGNEELMGLYRKIIPLRRMGTADEVAQVIAFLCSARASFVTGQVIGVDGGMTLQLQEPLARQLMGL